MQTNDLGEGTLLLPSARYLITVGRIGFRPESLSVLARPGLDTTISVVLSAHAAEIERVIVGATRSDRRIEDVPLRVEVLPRDEVEEKMLMTPGDISMMLNETGGLRVQSTSPSLGGASIRVQGLQGRYTLLLSDGLPLHGGQTGSFGLLQIPPMDLGQVEVIKGVASALYGSSALGGVVNLVSRRPTNEPERELLINQTTRNGSDVVGWACEQLSERWGYTLLASGHRQTRLDVDGDGWTDLPGYQRAVLRPRLFWSGTHGQNALLTFGTTLEERRGGTLDGFSAPDGSAYREALGTRRFDVGTIANFPVGASFLSLRGSATVQRYDHHFGATRERDLHGTYFGEAAFRASRGLNTGVVGLAIERESYRGQDVGGFDYQFTIPAAFAQYDVEPNAHLALSASARVDAHSAYGTYFNPRLSVLLRGLEGWTARASVGTGAFAPTPFTEDTEVTGLAPVRPLTNLRAERARSASLDIGGVVGPLELNATVFGSRISGSLQAREVAGAPLEIQLFSAEEPTITSGADGLVRLRTGSFNTTANYAYIRSTEENRSGSGRSAVPLTPTHTAGLVSVWEKEGRGRAGIEVYYTGSQVLEDNPYRARSPAYVLFGAMAELRLGGARVFVNLENLGNVRVTDYHPLVLRTRGLGGRWTTDAWGPLDGRTLNAGVRLNFSSGERD
jgi:iron complex outermembrane receptor protein